jgi:hypothetical protein
MECQLTPIPVERIKKHSLLKKVGNSQQQPSARETPKKKQQIFP